ncbi:hypothetical protein M9Y10_022330 [Tritrichomonas musculus]|uniref:PCI domain-containing protein n=1 Tax=Tritrichomonas musculus TaxID=1915356 RepID=A0ABR2KSZ2_9EUKA
MNCDMKTIMYDEENVIESFLQNVIHPVSCRYTIHLIANVSNIKSKIYLIDQMKKELKYHDRIGFASYIDRLSNKNYNGPTIYRDFIEERLTEQRSTILEKSGTKMLNSTINFAATAVAQTDNFYFWNAIQSYKRDTRVNNKSHFYEQRACLHICLDEWTKAYALSKKSQNPEYISVIGFSFGNFDIVLQNLDSLFLLIRQRKTSIVSVFELLHMIVFSFLCCFDFTLGENPKLDILLMFLQEENLIKPKIALQNFLQSHYKNAIDWIDSLENFTSLSLYMCFSFSMVQDAIRVNALVHFCYPFSSIKISVISDQFNIDEDRAEEMIQKACLNHKLNCKIDYVDKTLKRLPKSQESHEKQNILRQSRTTTIKLNEFLWKLKMQKQEIKRIDNIFSASGSQF